MSSMSVLAPRIIYVGMNVHKDSITLEVLRAEVKSPTRELVGFLWAVMQDLPTPADAEATAA